MIIILTIIFILQTIKAKHLHSSQHNYFCSTFHLCIQTSIDYNKIYIWPSQLFPFPLSFIYDVHIRIVCPLNLHLQYQRIAHLLFGHDYVTQNSLGFFQSKATWTSCRVNCYIENNVNTQKFQEKKIFFPIPYNNTLKVKTMDHYVKAMDHSENYFHIISK